MSETLYTCDCCVRNGNDEASCHRAKDLCVIGTDVVCEGCRFEEYPYDAFVMAFTPPHEKRIAELEQQLKMTKHNYSGAMSDIKELEQHMAALEAVVRDMVEGMLERGAEIRELRKQLSALQAKVAEYEYPLRTKETVTVPIEVWDAREQQLTELSKRNAKLVNICCLYDVPEAALLQGKGPKPPE